MVLNFHSQAAASPLRRRAGAVERPQRSPATLTRSRQPDTVHTGRIWPRTRLPTAPCRLFRCVPMTRACLSAAGWALVTRSWLPSFGKHHRPRQTCARDAGGAPPHDADRACLIDVSTAGLTGRRVPRQGTNDAVRINPPPPPPLRPKTKKVDGVLSSNAPCATGIRRRYGAPDAQRPPPRRIPFLEATMRAFSPRWRLRRAHPIHRRARLVFLVNVFFLAGVCVAQMARDVTDAVRKQREQQRERSRADERTRRGSKR